MINFKNFDFSDDNTRESVRIFLKKKYEKKCQSYRKKGKEYVFSDQQKYAGEIYNNLKNDCYINNFVAPLQWGKTGVFIHLIHLCCTKKDIFINPNNVHVISGMNDNEWKSQTQERLLPYFRSNVHHLHDISKLDLSHIEDSIIIIDECQIANQINQSISKMFDRSQIRNIDDLIRRNIRIIQISATPDNIIIDSNNLDTRYFKRNLVKYEDIMNSNSYIFFTKIEKEFLKESRNLIHDDAINELFEDISSFSEPKWHIIRMPGIANNNYPEIYRRIMDKIYDYDYNVRFYDSNNKLDLTLTSDEVLLTKPRRHTLILIKSKWRAAKSFTDKNIGVVFDRYTKYVQKDSVEVQSLAGRMIGHGKRQHYDKPIIYTNLQSVENYINLFQNSFDYSSSDWKLKYFETFNKKFQ